MAGRNVSFTAYLTDKMSAPLAKIAANGEKAFGDLQRKIDGINIRSVDPKVKDNTRYLKNSISDLKLRLNELERTREITIDIKQLRNINQEITRTRNQINYLEGGAPQRMGMLSRIGGGLGAMIGGYAAVQGVRNVINTGAEFEKYGAVLKNTLGSQIIAERELGKIQDFAAKTPFAVKELTSSFVKLTNQGFRPSMNEMRKLGDLASSVGKGFDQLSEAIIDAQTGEFERLKEFGIKASVEGDKIKFTFKGVSTEVKNSSSAIRDYVLSLGDAQGVSGSMAAISETMSGKISNLGDAFDGLKKNISEAFEGGSKSATGFFTTVVSGLSNLINFQNKLSQKGGMFAGIKDMFGMLKNAATMPFSDEFKNAGSMQERLQMLTQGTSGFKVKVQDAIDKDFFQNFNENFKKDSKAVINESNAIFKYLYQKVGLDEAKLFLKKYTAAIADVGKQNDNQKKLFDNQFDSGKDKASKSLDSGLTSVAGETQKVRNITINIDKLIENYTNQFNNLQEQVTDLQERIKEVLVRVLNDANYVAT